VDADVRSRTHLLAAPAATATGAVVAVGAAVVAGGAGVPLTPPCPLHALTGLWCPLCGGTRAVQSLAGGDVAAAAGANLLVLLAVPLLVVAWGRWTALRASGRPVPMLALSGRSLAVTSAVLVAFMVLRNLPGFEALTP
jgi:hypothetical protein